MSDELTTNEGKGQADGDGAVSTPAEGGGAGRPRVTRARATTTGQAKSRPDRARAQEKKAGEAAADTAGDAAPAQGGSTEVPPPPADGARSDGAGTPDATPEPSGLVKESVDLLSARDVDARMSVIGRADAEDVALSVGMLGGARADRVTVEMGLLGGAVAGEVHVTQGLVSGVLARDVHLEQAVARNVVAGHVTMGRSSGAFIVLAARVDGEVRSFLDPRAGLVFVGLLAVVATLLRLRRVVR
jgi:hypothetical protein